MEQIVHEIPVRKDLHFVAFDGPFFTHFFQLLERIKTFYPEERSVVGVFAVLRKIHGGKITDLYGDYGLQMKTNLQTARHLKLNESTKIFLHIYFRS